MKHFIIDGNNLIGKISSLQRLQRKDKQQSRVKLAFLIDNYFQGKNAKVTIHFDGYEQEPIKLLNCNIIYKLFFISISSILYRVNHRVFKVSFIDLKKYVENIYNI